MAAFTYDGAHFMLTHIEGLKLANRYPAGEDAFLSRIAGESEYVGRLRPREAVAWFVARLNFLTAGEIEASFAEHHSDDGCFLLPLTIAEANRQPSGIFEISGYPDRLVLRGGRDTQARNPADVFIRALIANPQELEVCRLRVIDPEAGRRSIWHCGWDGVQFIVY